MSASPQAVGRLNTGAITLELAKVNQGFVHSFAGGTATGEVVVEKPGADHIAHKHIARATYEDITLTVGTGMAKETYEYAKSIFVHKHTRFDMSFQHSDFNQNVTWQMDVFHTLLTAVGFPELDASSKDVGMLALTLSPEYTRLKAATGKVSQSLANKLKQWVTSNFRLTIPGLDCTRVSKIGALRLVVEQVSVPEGEERDYQKEPSGVTIPNLVVTLGEHAAQSFIDWHNTFVIQGRNDPSQEKEGTLEILGPDLKEVLFTLKFHGLGIFRLTSDKFDPRTESVRNMTAEMYCETMEFGYGPGAVGS